MAAACINNQTSDPEQKTQKAQESARDIMSGIKKVEHMDHPLNTKQDSKFKKFYDDKELWEEIEKDVKRTRVELAFFM